MFVGIDLMEIMDIDQRDEEIWRMRKEGATFSQIAERFDLSLESSSNKFIARDRTRSIILTNGRL